MTESSARQHHNKTATTISSHSEQNTDLEQKEILPILPSVFRALQFDRLHRAQRQALIQGMGRQLGNRQVQRFVNSLKTSPDPTPVAVLQRDIELPETTITGNPQFYARAERRNLHWAANPPLPDWPYDDRLRQLWNRRALDDFAEAVRAYQVDVLGVPVEEADGILGPRTATSLVRRLGESQIHESESRPEEMSSEETNSEETGSTEVEHGSAPLDPREAEVGEAPEWIMSYALDIPWSVHSVVYQEAMATGGIGIEGVAATWDGFLSQMGEMNFLGHPVVGHSAFLQRLDLAQRFLRANYPNIPERQLVAGVGSPGDRSQWRAAERLTASPHLFGMAIDVNAAENPWMSNPDEDERTRLYTWIIWRATWLMGSGTPVTPAESHRRAGSRSSASGLGEPQSTESIWQYFHDANQSTLDYLALGGDREAVASRLQRLGEIPPMPDSEYLPVEYPLERLRKGSPAIDDWMQVIEQDKRTWPNRAANGTARGFMNLSRELVMALRDHGGLQWGACDLGENQSGDMMHFALDPPLFFRFRNRVRQQLERARREMGRDRYATEQGNERRRRSEMAQSGRTRRRRRTQ